MITNNAPTTSAFRALEAQILTYLHLPSHSQAFAALYPIDAPLFAHLQQTKTDV